MPSLDAKKAAARARARELVAAMTDEEARALVEAARLDADAPPLDDVVAKAIGRSLIPSAVHIVDGLPRTKNGKILRRAIRARYLGHPLGDLSVLDQETPIELIPGSDGQATAWRGALDRDLVALLAEGKRDEAKARLLDRLGVTG